ncbi:MAG TPA: hypothetical protein PLV68_08405 [Ilumatobacteraceae bacterium]|nr:hypothetical protein [Ilumatobacteraceae bacterium]
MPWCEDCAKYHAPSAMRPDGTCPTCGRVLDAPKPERVTAKNLDLKRLAAGHDADADPNDASVDDGSAPWHFKLLMVLLILYLGWRFYQLIF